MREVQKYVVDLCYCPLCKGVWLDRDEINKIAKYKVNMNLNIIRNIVTEEKTTMMTIAIAEREKRISSGFI